MLYQEWNPRLILSLWKWICILISSQGEMIPERYFYARTFLLNNLYFKSLFYLWTNSNSLQLVKSCLCLKPNLFIFQGGKKAAFKMSKHFFFLCLFLAFLKLCLSSSNPSLFKRSKAQNNVWYNFMNIHYTDYRDL